MCIRDRVIVTVTLPFFKALPTPFEFILRILFFEDLYLNEHFPCPRFLALIVTLLPFLIDLFVALIGRAGFS